MEVVYLHSLRELRFLVQQQQELEMAVLFDAAWARQPRHALQREELVQSARDRGVKMLYVLFSRGDDAAEKYALDALEVNSLPALAIYDRGLVRTESRFLRQDEHFGESRSFAEQWQGLLEDDPDEEGGEPPLLLFVAGDKSSVGKSSTCLALLSCLLQLGTPPQDLGYIKPVTQCEAEQLVTRFCLQRGVACVGVGPVVFFKGFTRAFLAGETEPSSALVRHAADAVRKLGRGKRLVLVDGVGYPAVGSVCGVSNADVAQALGCPVLLVGKSGVGDAVDSYNLNAAYFSLRGVRVLGGVFNKLAEGGFYSRDSCAVAVSSYFAQYRPAERAYGFVPIVSAEPLAAGGEAGTEEERQALRDDAMLSRLTEAFAHHVQVPRLLTDLWLDALRMRGPPLCARALLASQQEAGATKADPVFAGRGRKHGPAQGGPDDAPAKRGKLEESSSSSSSSSSTSSTSRSSSSSSGGAKRSRQEIEADARAQGARGG